MLAGAAGGVEQAGGAQPLEKPAVERRLVGQPLRPVDHRVISIGEVSKHGGRQDGLGIPNKALPHGFLTAHSQPALVATYIVPLATTGEE